MTAMNQSDHDLLITLAARLEAHSQRESEVSRAMLAEISKISSKLDQIQKTQFEQSNQIRDLEGKQKAIERAQQQQDLRVATLEQQVDTLQDTAATQVAVSEALKSTTKRRDEEIDKKIKRYAFIMSAVSFLMMLMPKIVELAQHALATGTSP